MLKYLQVNIFFLFLIPIIQLNAQNSKIDSLRQILNKANNDSVRLSICYDLSNEFLLLNTDSAKFYLNESKLLNDNLKSTRNEVLIYLVKAKLFNLNMQNDSAVYYAQKAYSIAQKYNYPELLANSKLKLGLIYFSLNNFEKSYMYYREAQEDYLKLNDTIFVARCLSNIANIYSYQNKLDSSLMFYNKSLKIYSKTRSLVEIASTYLNIGVIWFFKGDFHNAIGFYKKALSLFKKAGRDNDMAVSYINIGEAQIHINEFLKSEKNLLKGYSISKRMQDKAVEQSALEFLYKLYKAKKDYKQALYYFEKYKALSDSVFSSNKSMQIAKLQTQFETEQKEHENKLLMIDNSLKNVKLKRANSIKVALLIIILLTVFVIIILLTNQKKLKKLNQRVLSQNKIITDQNEELMHYQSILELEISERTDQLEMALIKSLESDRLKKEFIENLSHEIRTPMNAILGFSEILELEDKVDNKYTEIIRNNMERLLELMDNLLELSKYKAGAYDLKIDSFLLMDVFEDLKKYAYQKRKFEKKEHIKLDFSFVNNHKTEIFKTDRHKLMSILQELVNNAIKYTEVGSVSVVFNYYENKLSVLIQDTGIGIKKEKLPHIFDAFSKINVANNKYRGTGIGLAFVKNIIDALNGNIAVESEVGKGSIFTVIVPGM